MPKPSEKFETEFWMRERELRKERAKIIEDISQSLGYGSSPLNAKEKMEMAKEFYDDVIKTGVYKTYSAFSHIYSENDIKNVLVSLFKEKYPQPTGTEVKVALKIINEYFLIEFNTPHPEDSKIELKNKSGVSSAVMQSEAGNVVGGIDFRKIEYLTQPIGSFQGLDLRLPLLSKAELEGMDINRELVAVEQMINAKIDVSTDRLKCLLAAMSQKDAFNAQRETQLLPLLLRLCWLKEEKAIETTRTSGPSC